MIRVFPWLRGKKCGCQCRRHRRLGYNPCVGKIPWRRKRQPTPVFLPGKSHRQRGLAGYSPWSHKESDVTECTHTHTHTHINTHIHSIYIYILLFISHEVSQVTEITTFVKNNNNKYRAHSTLEIQVITSDYLNVIKQREKYKTERRKYVYTLTHTHMNICICTYAHMHI